MQKLLATHLVIVERSIPASDTTLADTANGIAFNLKHVTPKDTLSLYATLNIPNPDSINILKVHQLIWEKKEVRSGAVALRKKNFNAITMIDQGPIHENNDCYKVALYQNLGDRMVRMYTYNVWLKTKRIEKIDFSK